MKSYSITIQINSLQRCIIIFLLVLFGFILEFYKTKVIKFYRTLMTSGNERVNPSAFSYWSDQPQKFIPLSILCPSNLILLCDNE